MSDKVVIELTREEALDRIFKCIREQVELEKPPIKELVEALEAINAEYGNGWEKYIVKD